MTGSLHTRIQLGALLGAIALAGLLMFLALPGCEPKPVPGSGATRPAEKVYTSRGRILMLPVAGKPTSDLVIHHEAIDDFFNPKGPPGMPAMEMPMPSAADVRLSEFAVGDVVEFDLSVWYTPEMAAVERYRVTRMKKLPGETVLRFGGAAPVLGPTKTNDP